MQLAGEEARKAVEIDPTDAEALADQAFAVGMAGDFNRGFEYIERALSINPNCVRAYRVKGWLLLNSGNPKEGREAFLFAIRIDPRSALDVTVQSHIADLYYKERDYENAVAAARRLVGDRPDHPWAYRWLAAALGQLGRSDEARVALDKAVAIAPDVFRLFVPSVCRGRGRSTTTTCWTGYVRRAGKVDVTAAAHQRSAATIETETIGGALPRGVSSVARPTSRSRPANIASCLSPTRHCLHDADDAQARQRRGHGGVCFVQRSGS